jgi:putative transposase
MATILAEKRSGCNCQKLQRSFSLVGSKSEDTTRFSGVEFQLGPTKLRPRRTKTPPASVVWSFNFSLNTLGTFELICGSNLMTPHFSSLTAAYQLHFYLWFKTHYRRPFLAGSDARSLVNSVLSEVCTRKDYHLLETDFCKDNLRLLVSLNPTQSVSEAVKFLKGNVSRQFGLAFGDQLRASASKSLWGQGYFARSSGKVNIASARTYVDSQADQHGYQGAWTKPLKFRNPTFKSPSFSFDHSVCILDYHLVIATQNRLALFDETIAPQLFNYIISIGRRHKFAVDRIGLLPDHVHLLIQAVPSLSVEACALAILENTRDWMTKHHWGILKEMNAWDVWQPSFYAGTIGEYSTAQVREFLRMC